jgi:hypothetical protein
MVLNLRAGRRPVPTNSVHRTKRLLPTANANGRTSAWGDETKTVWFGWIADHAQYFFWLLWRAGIGAFLAAVLPVADGFEDFEKHTDLVTAAFTVVLAISTISLWRATRGLWRGANEQLAVARTAAEAGRRQPKPRRRHQFWYCRRGTARTACQERKLAASRAAYGD